MTIGRSNSRRRRVFLDESIQSTLTEPATLPNDSAAPKSIQKTSKVYSNAARREGQLKTTDLIPQHIVSLIVVVGVCIGIILLINCFAINSSSWNSVLSPAALNTISLSGTGSISNWFSSFLLMLTGMASLQIYGMRRHRNDDYGGTYRVWLWMACLFALASVNCVVDFRSVSQSLIRYVGYGSGNSLSIMLAAKFIALTAIVVRGIIEIRASRRALVAVVLVWVAYTSAIVAQIPAVQNELTSNHDAILGNSILIGTLACFVSILSYARFVYLHANELIEAESSATKKAALKTKSKVKPTPVAAASTQKTIPVATPAAEPSKKTRKPGTLTFTKKVEENREDETTALEEAEENQEILSLSKSNELSKSERRRLRKLQKRQNRAA